MLRHLLRTGLVLVVLGIVFSGTSAFGRWGRGCGWGGGGYGGYGYGGYGCGYAGCGYGGYGGYGYGGYGYGGWGYPAGGYGGGYMPGAYPAPAPAPSSAPAPGPTLTPPYGPSSTPAPSSAPAPTQPPSASNTPAAMNTVVLEVTVPSDAKVIVNDLQTTSTGEHRRYMSRGLLPGRVYQYQVRAEFMRDGKATSDEQTVELTAGDTRSITLGGAAEPKVANIGTAAQPEL
jgi:uncharacterized protein (TIGR03000 family)